MSVPPAETTDVTECIVCRSSIPCGARKCIHCGSFQGWRRHLAVGDAFLALTVALVSVISMSLPMLRDTFKVRNSRVKVTFADTKDQFLFLIASNSGSAPGTVSSAQIAVAGLDAKFTMSRTLSTPPFSIGHKRTPITLPKGAKFIGSVPLMVDGWESDTPFIRPGESKRLRLHFEENRKAKLPVGSSLPRDVRCWLEIDVVQFDGSREAQTFVPVSESPEDYQLRAILWLYGIEFER